MAVSKAKVEQSNAAAAIEFIKKLEAENKQLLKEKIALEKLLAKYETPKVAKKPAQPKQSIKTK